MMNATTMPKTAATLVNELNKAISDKVDGQTVLSMLNQVNDAVKAENTEKVNAHADKLLAMPRVDMFNALNENPLVPGIIKLTKEQESGQYVLVDGSATMSFARLEKAFQLKNATTVGENGEPVRNVHATIANDIKYKALVSLFTDNIARYIAGEVGAATLPTNAQIAASRATNANFKSCSKNAMLEQLNAIVKAIMPGEICPEMVRFDLNAIIKTASQQNRVKADSQLSIRIKAEKAILDNILYAVATRRGYSTYTLTSAAKAHKADKVNTAKNADPKEVKAMEKAVESAKSHAGEPAVETHATIASAETISETVATATAKAKDETTAA